MNLSHLNFYYYHKKLIVSFLFLLAGTLGTLFQLFLTLGILLDYVMSMFDNYYLLNYVCLGITGAFFILLFFIPESHIYLAEKDQKSALNALRRLRGPKYDVNSELRERRKNNQSEEATKVTIKMIFSRPNITALCIVIGLMVRIQIIREHNHDKISLRLGREY